jgi:hypothetical protein
MLYFFEREYFAQLFFCYSLALFWRKNIGTKAARTEGVKDLDLQSELLIFESILTTFKLRIIHRGSWGSIENWLDPKTEQPSGN